MYDPRREEKRWQRCDQTDRGDDSTRLKAADNSPTDAHHDECSIIVLYAVPELIPYIISSERKVMVHMLKVLFVDRLNGRSKYSSPSLSLSIYIYR